MAVSMIGPKIYCWDRNGKPLAFGKLYTYQARTNTPKPTYQSEDQVVENTNPVILNGEGYANIYLDGSYKMVLKDSDENEIWSSDPVSSAQPDEWVNCLSATYVSPNSFKVPSNATNEYDPGRRVRVDNNASEYSYSTIESSVFAGGETSVTLIDSVVTTGISEVCSSIVGHQSQAANRVFNFKDLNEAKSSFLINEGDTVNLKEREPGSGGSGVWDVVESSSVIANDLNIVVSSSIPTLAFVLRIEGTLNLRSAGMIEGRDNQDVVTQLINGSDYSNTRFYLPNGIYDSSIGLDPLFPIRLEGESQLGTIINITDPDQDCFTWRRTSAVVKHLTFAGGRDGHVLGADGTTGNAGRELEMEDILFLNNGRDGRVFNGGWACTYSKIKIFNPGRHADRWQQLGFTNNVMTIGNMRVAGMGDPTTVAIYGTALRQCGYDGTIILEGNFNSNSVAMKTFANSLLGFVAKGLYGETHTEGYIDFTSAVLHDIEITCNLSGYEGPEGNTVYGIKDAAGMHIHDSNFTGDIMAPITSVNNCLVLNCHHRDKGGSYSGANLIFDPFDSNKVKITRSIVWGCGDNIRYAQTFPGYFQGEIPALSEDSKSVFGYNSIGYLPDGNDLDHMFTFRQFGTGKVALETLPMRLVFNFDGVNYNAKHAPAGTTVSSPSVGVFDITLPSGSLNNPASRRFYDTVFTNRTDSGSRLATAVPQIENPSDDVIRVRLYDSAGSLTAMAQFEQIHVSVSFIRTS